MRLAAFILGTAVGAYAAFVRPWMMRWGSTDDERSRALAGDEIVRHANRVSRAIMIDAPPGAVWPWLVQMGQRREPVPGERTRLLSRWNGRIRWPELPFRLFIYEPAHFIMETGFLHGLKERAEHHSTDPNERPVVATAGTNARWARS